MPLLIDGYNLLHVSGVFGRGTALTELHRSREALLAFLAAATRRRPSVRTTTIVFDAAGAPPGLPQSLPYEGIQRRICPRSRQRRRTARATHRGPRHAAEAGRRLERSSCPTGGAATAGEGDRQRSLVGGVVCRTAAPRYRSSPRRRKSQPASPNAFEVDYWVNQFSDVVVEEPTARSEKPPPADDIENPFPPGYGEDLLEE